MSSVYTRQPEPQQRILRMRELTKIVGLSRSTIYEKLNPESRYYDETFPKPVRLGAASVGWRSTSVDEWIASRSVSFFLKRVPSRSDTYSIFINKSLQRCTKGT